MKQFLFLLFTIPSIEAFAQPTQTDEPCIRWQVIKAPVFKFHKPKTNCLFGFGLCLQLSQLEIRIIPCDENPPSTEIEGKELVQFYAELDGDKVIFHFPKSLLELEPFRSQDPGFFGIAEDELPLDKEHSGVVVRLKEGEYPLERVGGQWLAKVDASVVRKTL